MHAMRGSVHVALDEGGARCLWGGGAGYVRFAEIEDVSLEDRLVGSPRLVLATAGGAIAMKIANAELLQVHGAIVRRLEEAKGHRPARALPTAFARAGRGLAEWLAALAEAVLGAKAYRDAPVENATLADVIADEHAEVDARAAGVHALVTTGEPDALHAVARTLVMHALPPLVLAAARLGRAGRALVDDEVMDEIAPFLDAADRAAVDALLVDGSHDLVDAHVAAALVSAKEEAIAEAKRASEAAGVRGTKWRRLQSRGPGAIDPGRWVGRTWAL
jgi:hypothetical protein